MEAADRGAADSGSCRFAAEESLCGEVEWDEQAEQRDDFIGGAMGRVAYHTLAFIKLPVSELEHIAADAAQLEIAGTEYDERDEHKCETVGPDMQPEGIKPPLPGRVPDVPQHEQAAEIAQAHTQH